MEIFTIENWRTGEIIHEGEAEIFKEFIKANKSNLNGAYLNGANLKGADLEGAYLRGANLNGADLEDAYLKGAYLEGAYLRDADLKDADLQDAYLEGAYLGGANLNGANFKNSIISINNKRIFAIKLSNSNIEDQNINEIKVIIGCKTKTITEWDTWFASDEEYETKRGTFEFRQIEAMYEAYKAYVVKLWS